MVRDLQGIPVPPGRVRDPCLQGRGGTYPKFRRGCRKSPVSGDFCLGPRGQPGKILFTYYFSRGEMGTYNAAVSLSQLTGEPANVALVRQPRSRSGIGGNLEQQITHDLGIFARAGIANGNVQDYEITDIDRTFTVGLSQTGKPWGRPDDTFGLAGNVNTITKAHQAYFNAGGLGIVIGDGALPHPGAEQILEAYYRYSLSSLWHVTLDYQFVNNPAYNRDRGPVSIIATRLHADF